MVRSRPAGAPLQGEVSIDGQIPARLTHRDPSGELFAVCPYDPKGNSVEPVLDSSRYFVVRLENEKGDERTAPACTTEGRH